MEWWGELVVVVLVKLVVVVVGGCGGCWRWWGVRGGGGDDGVEGVVNLMEVVVNFGGGREVMAVGFDEIGGGECNHLEGGE